MPHNFSRPPKRLQTSQMSKLHQVLLLIRMILLQPLYVSHEYKKILWHFPTLNWNTWGPVEKVSRWLKTATRQLKMIYHFRSFFLPLTFLFKILFQKLFLLICKVSLSAYNWTSTTVSLLAGWGNWVILPSISIVICYFFLIQTSIFFTFRKTITIWIFLYIHGVS